jgi:hypothetical protein
MWNRLCSYRRNILSNQEHKKKINTNFISEAEARAIKKIAQVVIAKTPNLTLSGKQVTSNAQSGKEKALLPITNRTNYITTITTTVLYSILIPIIRHSILLHTIPHQHQA